MTNPGVILLVEDNPNDIELTKLAFERSHISNELVVAEDGVEALEYLFGYGPYEGRDPNDIPALILMDLNMPKVDGHEVLRRVRSDERTKHALVVILTSSQAHEDILRGYDLHANSYIRKPVNFEHFSEVVNQLELYWLVLNQPPSRKAEGEHHAACSCLDQLSGR